MFLRIRYVDGKHKFRKQKKALKGLLEVEGSGVKSNFLEDLQSTYILKDRNEC